MTAQLVEALR